MASYDYACVNCDIQVTHSRSINDPEPEYMCETCGYKLNRVYSPIGVTFNGSGFYHTDNRK
jgi:putative FmdB family regulatory protein